MATLPALGFRIPAQLYADMVAAYQLSMPIGPAMREIRSRLAGANLFNRVPPVVNDFILDYSLYGDARGRRRFDLAINMHADA